MQFLVPHPTSRLVTETAVVGRRLNLNQTYRLRRFARTRIGISSPLRPPNLTRKQKSAPADTIPVASAVRPPVETELHAAVAPPPSKPPYRSCAFWRT